MRNRDILCLFYKKEGKELSGRKNGNIILLSVVFFVAVMSVGFASASLSYLRFKMDNPFINWVDIIAGQKVNSTNCKMELLHFLGDTAIQKHYNFEKPQPNYVLSMFFRVYGTNDMEEKQFEGRTIDVDGPVLGRILAEDNVVKKNPQHYSDNCLGLIVTDETLKKIGYTGDNYPFFVQLALPYDKNSCTNIGLKDELGGYYPVWFPVYAVVKQLPGMYSFLFTKRFWNDMHSEGTCWDITDVENNKDLLLCGTEAAINDIRLQIKDKKNLKFSEDKYCVSWKELKLLRIESNNDNPSLYYNQLVKELNVEGRSVCRIYDFAPENNYEESDPSYYSVQMNSLDSIRAFQQRLFDECGIKLDMTNVDAKENFLFVQKMGNVLSICIEIISLIFLCAFIYFLLRSHFQKMQKNLGTFKAFGVSTRSLVLVYILLMVTMMMLSFAVAFVLSLIIAYVISLFTIIESGYVWFDVNTWQNWLLFGISILASVLTTLIVAHFRLKRTPGDLIYDRQK